MSNWDDGSSDPVEDIEEMVEWFTNDTGFSEPYGKSAMHEPYVKWKTYSIEEANSKMQVYQAVAIKTNEDGERTEILEHELLLAESEQKARDKFVRDLSDEYDAGSDDVELTTFL